jgi:type I restriction enzyme S subunit
MNAERLLKHYERIADAPDAIARLRRFILDLAVRGKLVPPDPKDEPAAELLKRIAAEKARLVKTGEIRKEKPLPDIEPTERRMTRLLVGSGCAFGKSQATVGKQFQNETSPTST